MEMEMRGRCGVWPATQRKEMCKEETGGRMSAQAGRPGVEPERLGCSDGGGGYEGEPTAGADELGMKEEE